MSQKETHSSAAVPRRTTQDASTLDGESPPASRMSGSPATTPSPRCDARNASQGRLPAFNQDR